jgi:hypothetical protein
MLGETGDSRVIRGLSGSAFCDATAGTYQVPFELKDPGDETRSGGRERSEQDERGAPTRYSNRRRISREPDCARS